MTNQNIHHVLAMCIERKRQVLWTTPNRVSAHEMLRQCADAATNVIKQDVQRIRIARGQESIAFTNGSQINFVSRNNESSRGRTVDVLLIDEPNDLDECAKAVEMVLPLDDVLIAHRGGPWHRLVLAATPAA
jgi:phage FluMu gp28-like protein